MGPVGMAAASNLPFSETIRPNVGFQTRPIMKIGSIVIRCVEFDRMLQFGKGQARHFIEGAAWAWRAYLRDYKRNPVVPMRIADFASDHGLPEERLYNLLCLAFGADSVQFSDLRDFLPAARSSNCKFEYQTLSMRSKREIRPHIDQEMAKRVLDTNWLPDPEPKTVPQR